MRPVIASSTLVSQLCRTAMLMAIACPSIALLAAAQDVAPAAEPAISTPIVPQQMRFTGKLANRSGETVEATFRIFATPEGGEPLWAETQSLAIAEDGSYTVLLGTANSTGLPQSVFAGGTARWLAISVERGPESERTPLASVPYAMKSADAGTLSGHPASDFVTQQQLATLAALPASQPAAQEPAIGPLASGTVTGQGTAGTIPVWTAANTQGNSEITQSNSNVGINQATPGATLDVGGTVNVAGNLTLPPVAASTATAGQRSQLIELSSSSFSSTSSAPVTSSFKIISNFLGNDTASPAGRLEFHYQPSASALSLNVFSINGNGTLNFAQGQTFPGTIQSVTGTSPVSAAIASGAVTVGLNTTALDTLLNPTYAQLAAANTFTQAQTMNNSLTVAGTAAANAFNATSAYQIGGYTFGQGAFIAGNVNLGFSDPPASTETGSFNIGIGEGSLSAIGAGSQNVALGSSALGNVSSGSSNTAVGEGALDAEENGNSNTAIGANAGETATVSDTAGTNNTYIGANAGPGSSNLFYATAIGSGAIVNQSYAIALGGTGTDTDNVGIGTATPYYDYALDVEATTYQQVNGGIAVNAGGGNLYLGMTNGTHKFRVDTAGNVYGKAYLTSGADFAESVAVRGQRSSYQPGDLLVIDPTGERRLALAKKPYSTLVAGIYSTQPGMLASPYTIDDPRPATKEVPLAVVGIVPCKVTAENGPILVGDLLVTSSLPGHAMKGTDRRQMLGAVVGKALQPLSKGVGVIQVLVTLQ